MEAGNRCFDERVPEEINRRIVDHISDINLPYSDISREYLLREGLPPDRVIKTGSPMFEVLHYYLPRIQQSDVLKRLKLEKGRYFIVSSHREENVDGGRIHCFVRLLNRLAAEYNLPILTSTHPRTRKRLQEADAKLNKLVQLHNPFGFCDYVHLQLHARATLSDSGTIAEESSILNFPALNLRDAHERPEAMEEASVMMVGYDENNVLEGLRILEKQAQAGLHVPHDYQAPNVSEKVVRIIESYTSYVNRVVWRKDLNAMIAT
jgi:UDP-N-acetylglucosamine 2-epimerase (non-hydrolysing)